MNGGTMKSGKDSLSSEAHPPKLPPAAWQLPQNPFGVPQDIYNQNPGGQCLLPERINPEPDRRYNLVVIGGARPAWSRLAGLRPGSQSGPGGAASAGKRLPQLWVCALQSHCRVLPSLC
jgi:hypothetical protein